MPPSSPLYELWSFLLVPGSVICPWILLSRLISALGAFVRSSTVTNPAVDLPFLYGAPDECMLDFQPCMLENVKEGWWRGGEGGRE